MSTHEIEILLVEDDPNDVELTLLALRKNKLANKIHVARDGEEALDFLFCRGPYSKRNADEQPRLILATDQAMEAATASIRIDQRHA